MRRSQGRGFTLLAVVFHFAVRFVPLAREVLKPKYCNS